MVHVPRAKPALVQSLGQEDPLEEGMAFLEGVLFIVRCGVGPTVKAQYCEYLYIQ